MKSLVVFDLDGTLAPSKSSLDAEMAALLGRLLGIVKVAVISGGAWTQFEKQVLAFLPHDDRLKGLSMLPTCGTKFYRFDGDWKKLYSEDFSADDKKKIISALDQAVDRSGFRADKHWGDLIEDRDSQITFSALGQAAPLAEKAKWDPDFAKRQKIEAILEPMIPGFSIRLGGATSIDVTRPGIDKAYGIKKLKETLGVPIADMIFVGDAIFPGGNDYPAEQAGVEVYSGTRPGRNQAGRRGDLRLPGEVGWALATRGAFHAPARSPARGHRCVSASLVGHCGRRFSRAPARQAGFSPACRPAWSDARTDVRTFASAALLARQAFGNSNATKREPSAVLIRIRTAFLPS